MESLELATVALEARTSAAVALKEPIKLFREQNSAEVMRRCWKQTLTSLFESKWVTRCRQQLLLELDAGWLRAQGSGKGDKSESNMAGAQLADSRVLVKIAGGEETGQFPSFITEDWLAEDALLVCFSSTQQKHHAFCEACRVSRH